MRKRLGMSLVLLAPLRIYAATQILVPAYFDPSTSTDWSTLNASVSSAVPITAIMNPNSGPDPTASAAYTAAITSFQAAGGKVVAYVHTTDGKRSITTVENEIALYKSEYPTLNGIFIDEMANTSGKLSYYKSLYSYIKTQNANWQVIGNPGTSTLETYLSPTPAAANVLVTFENATGYSTYTPSTWQANYNASNFANIAYAQADVATMQSDVSLAAGYRAGSIYFSDLTGTNPYASLPTYWSQEVAAVRAENLKVTYTVNGSGDYNLAANWTGPVPNAVGAEADFSGSITANHTVYSDSPVTVGKITFNNTNSYVLAGAGSLNLQTSSGSAAIDAQAGTQKITLPITVTSSAVFSAETGATLIIDAPVTVLSGQSLTESGGGHVTFLTSVTVQSGGSATLAAGTTFQSLVLQSGANATVLSASPDSQIPSQLDVLAIQPGSTLDVGNSTLIIHNGDLAGLTQSIRSGQGLSGGIVSSNVRSDLTHLTSLGVISVAQAGVGTFDGTAISAGDVLVKQTEVGDADLNGVVDATDYLRIDAGFTAGLSGWYNGDFNYDGVVNGSDYALIDNAYDATHAIANAQVIAQSTAQIASSVPEPQHMVWVGIAAVLAFYRARRQALGDVLLKN